MPYDLKFWKERHDQRIDISQRVTHLTRGVIIEDPASAIDVLLQILEQQVIRGSSSELGFIVGPRKAVCFQDAPLLGLAQNVEFEHAVSPKLNRRPSYEGCGVSFGKRYAWSKGARPVMYEQKEVAKAALRDEREFWRIVSLDLSDKAALVDWTHEREWRCPDEFTFERAHCALVVGTTTQYKALIDKIPAAMLKELSGVSVLRQSIA